MDTFIIVANTTEEGFTELHGATLSRPTGLVHYFPKRFVTQLIKQTPYTRSELYPFIETLGDKFQVLCQIQTCDLKSSLLH